MKKYVSIMLIVCLLLVTSRSSIAAETLSEVYQINNTTASVKTVETISNIPVYVTYIDDSIGGNIEAIKEEANETLNNANIELKSGSFSIEEKGENEKSTICIENNEFKIVRVSDAGKTSLLDNPLFVNTFNRVNEMVEKGTKVSYLNFYLPETSTILSENSAKAATGGIDDPAYWESNYNSFGTYSGYKFLYLEAASGVETSEVTPGNLSAALKWNEIAKKTLEAVLDHYVKGDFYKAVKAVSNALSTVFSIYHSPLTVTYGASSGYVKAKVSGDLYLRTILIRDDKDRISGYAYYPWGSTERFAAALRVDAKYPYYQNASGTFLYDYPSYTYPTQYSYTPGYYGNSTIYSSIIDLYNNTFGYFTHDENININSVVANLLN